MTPIIYPAPIREQFYLTGSGALLLTENQRKAKSLTVTIEKVKDSSVKEYYNFRPPEPRSFWGYLQLVQRDFIVREIQLEYRRHQVLHWDRAIMQYMIEMRCLVKALGKLTICGLNAVLNDNTTPDPGGGGGNEQTLEDCLPDWVIARDRSDQVQTDAITAIWYSFEPGFSGFCTLTIQDYAKPCDDEAGSGTQAQPTAQAPASGESGSGGAGGGGERGGATPPSNRTSDPLSDISRPPQDVPGGPPSPEPQTQVKTKVLTTVTLWSTCTQTGTPVTIWDDVRLFNGRIEASEVSVETFGSGSFPGTIAGFNIKQGGSTIASVTNPALLSASLTQVVYVPVTTPDPTRPENIQSDPCLLFP